MTLLALLATALLFGGMVLYSFGSAAFLFSSLPAMQAGPLLRRAFPHFYLFVLVASVVAALCLLSNDMTGTALMGLVAATVIPTRHVFVPAINWANGLCRINRVKGLLPLSPGILE